MSAALSAAAAAVYSAYTSARGRSEPSVAVAAAALASAVRRYAGVAAERFATVQRTGRDYAATTVNTGLDPLRDILDGFAGRVLGGEFAPTDEKSAIAHYLDQLWKEVR